MTAAPFVHLWLPEGWSVTKDALSGKAQDSDAAPFGLGWGDLTEDLLFAAWAEGNLGIDLGWYPDRSPTGEFCMVMIHLNGLMGSYAHPIREFKTRSARVAVATMESWMMEMAAKAAAAAGKAAQALQKPRPGAELDGPADYSG